MEFSYNLPLWDELYCRPTAVLFIKSCLQSANNVSTVARYDIYYGSMNSHLGRNAYFCCSRYDVADILCHLTHGYHIMLTHISTQHRAAVLPLLELLFVREGILSCPLLSADDVDMFVDFIK